MESIQACHTIMTREYQLPAAKDIESILDKKSDFEMLEIIRTIFLMQCAGQDVSPFIIPIIKNASTTTFKPLKRVLHQFWLQLDCYESNGQLKPYVLLFCNSLRQDLGYANEYIVCSALRCIAGFGVREVVQHVVSGIPALLEHQSPEVRATAAITIRALDEQFPHIVNTGELTKRILVEKNTTVLQEMIKSVAQVDEKFFQQHIYQICENFNYLGDQYEIGMGLIAVYDKLPQTFREQLIDKLRIQPQLPSILLQAAGQRLLSVDPPLGAQLLVLAAKNAPAHIQSHTIRLLGRIWDNANGVSSSKLLANIARPLAQVFTGGSESNASRGVQLQLFQSRIFQRLCASDQSACQSVLESLTSSPALEHGDLELAGLIVNAVCEISQEHKNSRAISPASLNRLIKFVIEGFSKRKVQNEPDSIVSDKYPMGKSRHVQEQHYLEASQEILGLLLYVFKTQLQEALSGVQQALEKIETALLGILEVLLSVQHEQVFKIAAYAYVDMLEAIFSASEESAQTGDQTLKQKAKMLSDAFLLLLPLPQEVELVRDEATAEYFRDTIAPLLQRSDAFAEHIADMGVSQADSTNEAKDGDIEQGDQQYSNIPVYVQLKSGMCGGLAVILAQIGCRLAYLFDHKDFIVQRLLIGFAHLLKKIQLNTADREAGLTCLRDIYIYAEGGEKTMRQQKITFQAVGSENIESVPVHQSSSFSFFGGSSSKNSSKENMKSIQKAQKSSKNVQNDKNAKAGPYEMVSERPELINNVYQLSADADLIYAEALALQERTQIILVVLFVNRTSDVVESLQLELFTSGSLRRYQQPKEVKLAPHQRLVQVYELSIAQCTSAIIYGNILARFSTPKARPRHKDVVMRIKEIQFDIRHFIRKKESNLQGFSRLWAAATYDVQCQIPERVSRENLLEELQNINLTPLVSQEIQLQSQKDDETQIYELLYAGATVTGEPVLLAISKGLTTTCKVRGDNRDVCQGLCQYLSDL